MAAEWEHFFSTQPGVGGAPQQQSQQQHTQGGNNGNMGGNLRGAPGGGNYNPGGQGHGAPYNNPNVGVIGSGRPQQGSGNTGSSGGGGGGGYNNQQSSGTGGGGMIGGGGPRILARGMEHVPPGLNDHGGPIPTPTPTSYVGLERASQLLRSLHSLQAAGVGGANDNNNTYIPTSNAAYGGGGGGGGGVVSSSRDIGPNRGNNFNQSQHTTSSGPPYHGTGQGQGQGQGSFDQQGLNYDSRGGYPRGGDQRGGGGGGGPSTSIQQVGDTSPLTCLINFMTFGDSLNINASSFRC